MKKYIWMTVVFLVLCGCACPPEDPQALKAYQEADDPLEPMNRAVFGFNMRADSLVIKPVAEGYRYVAPQIVRTGISNFFTNLRQPMYFVNAALQLEGQQAAEIAGRFVTNTLFGFFGFADTASDINIPVHDNDFGQTLYVWGVKNGGPYLVLPFLGPSNPRDAVGVGVDAFLAPIDWLLYKEPALLYSRIALENWSKREQALDFLDSLEKSSTDFYATLRSMYRQNRKNKLENTDVAVGSDQVVKKKD